MGGVCRVDRVICFACFAGCEAIRGGAVAGLLHDVGPALRHQLDMRRVGESERQQVAAQPDLQRVAERRPAHRFKSGAGQQSHFHEAACHRPVTADMMDDGAGADRQLVKGAEALVHGGESSSTPLEWESMAWSLKVRLSLSFESSVYLGPNRSVKGLLHRAGSEAPPQTVQTRVGFRLAARLGPATRG